MIFSCWCILCEVQYFLQKDFNQAMATNIYIYIYWELLCIQFEHFFCRLLVSWPILRAYMTIWRCKVYANIHFSNIRYFISSEYMGDYINIYAYTAGQGMRRFLVQNSTKSLWILISWYPNEQHFISMIVLVQQWYQFVNITTTIFSLWCKFY